MFLEKHFSANKQMQKVNDEKKRRLYIRECIT